MADMKPITFKSRDNLDIHGYLTLPKGRQRLIFLWLFFRMVDRGLGIHGDTVRMFNFGKPWLCSPPSELSRINRLRQKFLEAGNKQWGKAMQDDLTDGVNWLVKKERLIRRK